MFQILKKAQIKIANLIVKIKLRIKHKRKLKVNKKTNKILLKRKNLNAQVT